MLKKPAAMFFDWDGTLVDSFSFLEAAHNHVLEGYGMQVFEKGGFIQYFGKPREEIYPAVYGEKADDARGKFEQFVIDNHKTMLDPMDDTEMLLKTVHSVGVQAGVVSNKKAEFVNAEVDYFEWRKFFLSVVGAREAANDKPSPEPLFLGIERANIGADMSEIWYVGDTVIDQECARRAGTPFVYINHHDEEQNAVLDNKPDLVVKNCKELADFLLQYSEN